ncbi:hypothetical protein [Oharaeibacter diazotrophicus]|uniref:Uncharacterized protein n=1 Tax=Oharaeibacter diazotrophicus TaxID=1920512 RepID=A0A4R6RIB9_9HYPH|nr:hypothetical protein [Oharaeibacter diazotrophicus]TDP85406.1 hypothetical protein EDD54_2259 [Oharaeibacter diazotrophicus]BBE74376.1 hypothetical protein OHA_1_04007 [Pleomorphomonas sp. SM30]GLS75931.1 hypothetical protein GCM10007904_12660 [Oharaeibacter diazotrophicus]
MEIDDERVRTIAREAAKEAVRETLIALGIDAADPREVQADMQHLRDWRLSVAAVKRQGIVSAVGLLTVGMLGLVWMAIRGGGLPPGGP